VVNLVDESASSFLATVFGIEIFRPEAELPAFNPRSLFFPFTQSTITLRYFIFSSLMVINF